MSGTELVQKNDVIYATVIIGFINLIQAITPIIIYFKWARYWVEELHLIYM